MEITILEVLEAHITQGTSLKPYLPDNIWEKSTRAPRHGCHRCMNRITSFSNSGDERFDFGFPLTDAFMPFQPFPSTHPVSLRTLSFKHLEMVVEILSVKM
jgi:hypothetical protein